MINNNADGSGTTQVGGYLLPQQLKRQVKKKDLVSRLLWGLGHVITKAGLWVFGLGQEIQGHALTEMVIIDDFPGYMMERSRIQFREPKFSDFRAQIPDGNDIATNK